MAYQGSLDDGLTIDEALGSTSGGRPDKGKRRASALGNTGEGDEVFKWDSDEEDTRKSSAEAPKKKLNVD